MDINNIPVDMESGAPLIRLSKPRVSREGVALGESKEVVLRILKEYHREDVLRSWGLRPVSQICFYGPTGYGKTLTAKLLAYELERPFCRISADTLSPQNLRKVMEFLQGTSVVAIFDQFDALLRSKDLPQIMDEFNGKSLIIFECQQLPPANFLRRVEEVQEFGYLSDAQIIRLLNIRLRGVHRQFEPTGEVVKLFRNATPAHIAKALNSAIKDMVLDGQEFLGLKRVEKALERLTQTN
jgi:hypothetical protein